jgi:predicted transglutaminase-like cysteine proteinase
MLRLLVALLVLAVPTAAFASTAAPIPVDRVAQERFPKESAQVVDAIAELNRMVNAEIQPTEDSVHYGMDDKWVSMPKDHKGDCEDFATSKFVMLEEAGYPAIQKSRIRTVIVLYQGQIYGHAILEVRLPNGSIAELDNNFDEPMTREELERWYGYTFFDW